MSRSKPKTQQVDIVHPSVSAALADLNRPFTLGANQALSNKHRDQSESKLSWHGMEGGAQAVLTSIRKGWPKGEEMVRSLHDEIAPTLPRAIGVNRCRVRGDQGDELDIHAVNRGQVDRAWSRSVRRVRVGSSILRLYIDVCGNCSVSARDLAWRGVAGLALAEVMQKAGYSVEILAASAVSNPSGRYEEGPALNVTVSTVIKARSAQPDIGLLSATACLSGFFRIIGFSGIIRACDDIGLTANSGLGSYLDVSGVLPVDPRVTTLCVRGSEVYNRETAMQWVRQSVTLLQGARV